MMANVMLKSLKCAKLLNRRLSFSSVKSYYYVNRQYIARSLQQRRPAKSYVTAAHKHEPREDLAVKSNVTISNSGKKDVFSIDDALPKIDSIIRRAGRIQARHVYEAFSFITSKDLTSSRDALYLIRSCNFCIDIAPSKRIELADQIWNKYQELGFEFDVRHYNSLLDVRISNGLNFNPVEILESMENRNIQPNKGTYLLIMKKYCKDGDIVGASEILEHMKKDGLSIDEKVFNYLIEGHIKNNDFTGATEMVDVMRSSNLHPNAKTHCILACGFAASGKKDEMLSHLEELGEIGSAEHYLEVIDALATSGNHQHIDEVLSLIQNKEMYTHYFLNAAVELIYKDQLDVAYKLVRETCSSQYNEGSNIFIKQLIKEQKPIPKVLEFSQRIFDEGINRNIYLIASRITAENGQIDYALAFFQKMLENGQFLRGGNFWPLFLAAGENKSSQDIWLILKKMKDFGVLVDSLTYLEYVYPALGVPEPEDVLKNIKKTGQTLQPAANNLFVYYCNRGEIDFAYRLTQIFPVSVMNQLDVDLFLGNCVNLSKESMKNFLKLLKFIFMEAGEDSSQNHVIQGTLLAQLILKKMKILEDLLTKHVDVKFNRRALYLCEQEIRQKNPSRVPLVRRLRSINSERSILSKEDLSVEEENKYLSHLQAENIPCRPFLTKRILHHMKTKNAERVSELLALFDELKLQHSPLMFANLLAMYVTAGDIEKAREALNKLQTEFPDFNLDLAKLLDYATNLIKYEKFDESYEVLKNLLKEPYSYSSKEKVYICLRSFITQLSNVNDIELVRKMQNLIFPLSKELGFKKLLLEPAINYHLQRNDLKSAVEEFRNTIMKHRTPCCLGPIFRKCLKIDDKNTLQRVVDLAMGCSGKSYVLLELAVACIENNDIQKAVNVIESLGRETDPRDLDGICNRLSLQNKLNELEQLIYITKSLDHVDREDLYMHAFRACDIKNDLERAKKLFHSLQKEVGKPKPEILSFVENMLKIPRQSDTAIPSPASPEIESFAAETTKTFIEQVKVGNAATALSELNALKKGYIRTLPLKTMTDLMDLCLQQNCTTDLSANVQAMSYIIENGKDILHPLLVKYSEAGDVEKFSTISSFMPDFCLMKCSFNTYFCKAYITSGQYENLLAELEQRSDKKNKMYSTIAFEELLKFPQFEDRVFNLALKYMDASYNTPMAIVWSHYFIKEDFEKAEEIFKKYPVQIERTDAVIRSIRENENILLALRYVDFIKNTSARQRVKERAFGVALDLLVSKEKYDEAVALVVESEKMNLLLYKYYVKPLITLKNVLEKQNKPIPFTVPQDSSSDSD